MAQPETLAGVKLALRISHGVLDEDILADIDACLADLSAHGVNGPNAVEKDPLVYNAIKLYCRSMYLDDTAKAEVWRQRYIDLRASLSARKGYGWAEEVAANG